MIGETTYTDLQCALTATVDGDIVEIIDDSTSHISQQVATPLDIVSLK